MAARPHLAVSADKECTDSGFTEEYDGQIANVSALDERHNRLSSGRPEYSRSASCDTNVQGILQSQDEDGDTFLHIAIREGYQEQAEKIINRASRTTLEIKNNLGMTPLVESVMHECHHLVEMLLNKGISIDSLHYQTCNNVLHICVESGDYEMLQVIGMADKHNLMELAMAKNDRGQTPFHVAVLRKDINSCCLLTQFGAQVDAKDGHAGYTGLHLAVLTEDSDFVAKFIGECNPALNLESSAGYTPFGLAVVNSLQDIQAVLLQAGASDDIGSADDDDDDE